MENQSEEMKRVAKSHSSNPSKSSEAARRDRKSGTGMKGSPKKGGHGGKFTWSGEGPYSAAEMGIMNKPVSALDAKDPNFDDPDD